MTRNALTKGFEVLFKTNTASYQGRADRRQG